MGILKDYLCRNPDCVAAPFEYMREEGETVYCPLCKRQVFSQPVATKSYSIKGDNSASVTPKKHRKEK